MMTTEEKLELLTRDFLERDGDTFVRIRRTGRLGWEDTLPKESPYSSYILRPQSDEELIRTAHGLAQEMLTAMDTPYRIHVRLGPDVSYTDSRTVMVGTKVFEETDMSAGQKLDAFIGFAVHEGCHLLYTDFGVGAKAENSTVKTLENIIEDERIERECGERKPGLLNFVAATKRYTFGNYTKRLGANWNSSNRNIDAIARMTNAILCYVRYPATLDPKDLEDYCDLLLTVRETLTPYPASTEGSLEAARAIYRAMVRQREKEKEQEEEQQNQQQQQEQENRQNGQDAQQSGPQGADGSDSQQQSSPSSSSSDDNGQDGQNGQDGCQDNDYSGENGPEEGSGTGNGNPDTEQELEDAMSQLRDALSQLTNMTDDGLKDGLSDEEIAQAVKDMGAYTQMVCEGVAERGITNRDCFIKKATDDEGVYRRTLDQVKQYIPAIRRSLEVSSLEYRYALRGCRSGKLDTGKLAEAYQGVQTVYVREGEVRTDKIAVCMLIDESGSMWGDGETAARQTAVLLNEALSRIPNTDLYIYGHTATRGATELFVYREKGFHPKWALGSTDSRAGNHDSIAIREAAARIRRHTDRKCLLFVISDGAPNEGTQTVRKAVQDVTRDGFEVVAVSIDACYDPALMYDHNVTFSDLGSLAPDLGKMVKSAIQKNTKRHNAI